MALETVGVSIREQEEFWIWQQKSWVQVPLLPNWAYNSR